MPVGNQKTVEYYSIRNNKIRHKIKDDPDVYYDWIEGNLTAIETDFDNKFEGKPNPQYIIKFEPDDHSYLEILTIGKNSSAARGLFASLTTIPDDDIRQVRIRPYPNSTQYEGEEKNFTNVDVSFRSDSNQEWTRLIEVEEKKSLYKAIFKRMPEDEAARNEYVARMVDAIRDRLNSQPAPETKHSEHVDERTGEIYAAPDLDGLDDLDDDLPF